MTTFSQVYNAKGQILYSFMIGFHVAIYVDLNQMEALLTEIVGSFEKWKLDVSCSDKLRVQLILL